MSDTFYADYFSLMNKPRVSFGIRNYYDHVWYAGIERRNQPSRRISKLHKSYRNKKRGW